MPSAASFWRRRLVRNTSLRRTSACATSRPSGRRRSRVTLRLPRLSSWKAGFTSGWYGTSPVAARPRRGSPSGGSIFTTRAPQSASTAAAEGTATQMPSSSTRTPSRAPAMAGDPATGARPSANRLGRATPHAWPNRPRCSGRRRTISTQRLKLHYVDWGNADERALLLLHGGRDHCRSWDWVAADLRRDFHLIAPDLRGHGDSAWAVGSTYSMIDYVLDLAALLKTLDLFPITIIGHSLGARVALQYAGIYPDRVARLVAIEGLGPPAGLTKPPSAAARMLQWLREMQALARRHPRPYATLEEAITRMREANPHLSEEQARHLTVSGVIRHEDGTYAWKFDNFVRAVSPYLFNVDEAREIWSHITCPVLLVRGKESWAPDPEAEGHAAAFRHPHLMTVERAGHWVHHDQLAVFLRGVRQFLEAP